jgi:signal transduction histidine kinase
MKNKLNIFSIKSLANQTLAIYIVGILILAFLYNIVAFQFNHSYDSSEQQNRLHRKISQIIHRFNNQPHKVVRLLNQIKSPKIKSKIISHKPKNSIIFSLVHPGQAIDSDGLMSYEFKNKTWLVIKITNDFTLNRRLIYFISLQAILALMLFFLSFWAIRRASLGNDFAQETLDSLSENINTSITSPSKNKEIINLTNKLKILQNQLKKQLFERTKMLAAISHDLRTPITRLKLRTELMDDTVQAQQMFSDISEMEMMLKSVLEFSKDFMHEEQAIQINLSELVNSICEDFKDMGLDVSTNIKINIIFEGRVLSLKRAIINIIDNAIKYGSKATVILKTENKKIILTICDEGFGLSQLQQERVFSPFYRCDETRNNDVKGSGLGLSIAKEVIGSHGGSIELSNQKPNGLQVKITLNKSYDFNNI